MNIERLPKVLVLTEDCISVAHGTGTSLLRHFTNYPEDKLFNVCWREVGEPAFRNTYAVESLRSTILMRTSIFLSRFIKEPERHRFVLPQGSIRKQVEQVGFVPDIIYACCISLYGMQILSHLMADYDGEVPVLPHFLDYVRDRRGLVEATLKMVSPSMPEVWSLTQNIADEISNVLGRKVTVVRILQCEIPPSYKSIHHEFHSAFRAVMVGNCWPPSMLRDIQEAWRWVDVQLGGIPPIQWYCHPTTMTRAKEAGIQVGVEIQYGGFFLGDAFFQKLREADIAIIPFNRERVPESDYARFSLPSRITELASVGLPMFFAAGPQTETERYVRQSGIGLCGLLSNAEQFRQSLLSFVKDKELRTQCGINARQLAVDEFDIQKYQKFLYDKLSELARKS